MPEQTDLKSQNQMYEWTLGWNGKITDDLVFPLGFNGSQLLSLNDMSLASMNANADSTQLTTVIRTRNSTGK